MNDSARAGLEALADRGAERGADDVLAGARASVRRRRVRTRAMLGVVAVLAVAGGVVAVVSGRDADGGREIATQPSPAPPTDEGPVRMVLSDDEIPASGALVLAFLLNEGADQPTFGVATALDRWDGSAWVEQFVFGSCLDHWHCAASLEPATAFEDIGLSPPPGGAGPAEWIRVEGLEPGWYRFRKVGNEGVTATGTFEVVERDVTTADFADPSGPALLVRPLARPGETQSITASPPSSGMQTATDVDAFEASLGDTVRLDRRQGASWDRVAELDFSVEAVIDATPGPGERYTRLPTDLTPGTYRVLRDAPDGELVAGYFLVLDATPSRPTLTPADDAGPVMLFLSDTTLPASGAEIGVVVRNDGGERVPYGPGFSIDHWQHDGWKFVRNEPERVVVHDVARSAAAGSSGHLERLTIGGLEPGLYRLRKAVAVGLFWVVDESVETTDLSSPTYPSLEIHPTLVRSDCAIGATCAIRIGVVADGDLADGGVIEHWVGGAWKTVGELDHSIEDIAGQGPQPGQRMSHIPPDLEPGAYRVVGSKADGTPVVGHFWVVE